MTGQPDMQLIIILIYAGLKDKKRGTIHPAEAFTGDHLKIDTLISVLGVDQV